MSDFMEEYNRRRLEHQEYLSDGVYVGWDGYHIVLFLQDSGMYGPLAVALNPQVLLELERYRTRLHEKLSSQSSAPR